MNPKELDRHIDSTPKKQYNVAKRLDKTSDLADHIGHIEKDHGVTRQSTPIERNDNSVVNTVIKLDNTKKDHNFMVLTDDGKEDLRISNTYYHGDASHETTDKHVKAEPVRLNAVTQFYIGSLTIVGLFVLYRMLQKSK